MSGVASEGQPDLQVGEGVNPYQPQPGEVSASEGNLYKYGFYLAYSLFKPQPSQAVDN